MLQCSYNVNTVSCLLHTVNAQLQYDMVCLMVVNLYTMQNNDCSDATALILPYALLRIIVQLKRASVVLE
jgi:hypothetical protein